jgi:hypothetical protein
VLRQARLFVTFCVGVLLMAVALEGPSQAQASIGFVNGSFESGGAQTPIMSSCPGWGSWLGPAGSGSKFGIAASSSAPDVAEQGTFYAFFHATANVADCVGQTLNTVPGNKYVVSFWLATDGPTDGTTDLMQLSWGPDFGASSNDVVINSFAPHSSSAVPYQQFTYTITALTSHDIFTFHGYDATSNILLDNVTVTPASAAAAPAMTSWQVILLGVLLLVVGAFVRSSAAPRARAGEVDV